MFGPHSHSDMTGSHMPGSHMPVHSSSNFFGSSNNSNNVRSRYPPNSSVSSYSSSSTSSSADNLFQFGASGVFSEIDMMMGSGLDNLSDFTSLCVNESDVSVRMPNQNLTMGSMYIPDPNEMIFLDRSNPFSSHDNINFQSVFGSHRSHGSMSSNSNLSGSGKKRTNLCFHASKSLSRPNKKYKYDGIAMFDVVTEHVDNSMYACSNNTRTTIDTHVEYCEEAEDEVEANTNFDEVPVIDVSMYVFIEIVYNDVPYYIAAPSHLNQEKIVCILGDFGIHRLGLCKSFKIVSKPEYISINDFIKIPHPDLIYVNLGFAHQLRGLK